MEMRDEHWDESLWHNSLKLHLTGRNAASIYRDAIRAALLAVGVNPKDIVDLWHGEISHQINLSLKYEGGVMACLTANTIDLPNGVKGNFLHANRTLADIKVHRVPACFQTEHSVSCSSKYAPSGRCAPSTTKMVPTPG